MIAPARRAALDALRAVNDGQADLPDALARVREPLADDRDKALAAELAHGTLRWMGEADHLIVHAAGRPLTRLDPVVRDILRLSIYQLLHLDRVPAAAVVDDAVRLTKAARKTSAAGFVNGVLRTISRTRHALPLPPRPVPAQGGTLDVDAALSYLSITLSHPRWLVERWVAAHGFEAAEAWARFDNEAAPLTLRANTLRAPAHEVAEALRRAGIETEPTRYAPDGLLVRAGQPLRAALAREGLFLAQDEASQLVAHLAAARPGDRVLDACASPGGKTVALAAQARDAGLLVAADLRDRRVALLRQTIRTTRVGSARVVQADLAAGLPFGPVFDVVLVDAPCSGLGTIRRDPEIRWRRSPADLAVFARRQVEMLVHAAAVVRPGGRLVYATCSSEPDENEAVVRAFLDRTSAYRGAGRSEVLAGMPPTAHHVIDDAGHLRTWPWRHGLEAFFGAVLVRAS